MLLLLLLSTSNPPSTAAAALQHPPPQSRHSPAEYSTYIVLLRPRPDGAHLTMSEEARREWHLSFLPGAFTDDGRRRLVSSYGTIFYGFCALLTGEELDAVSRMAGFGRSFLAGNMYPVTTRTPEFLGLTKSAGYVWDDSNYGKGAIIGVVDTGAHWQHPSFDDSGMPPPPEKWRGDCDNSFGFRCNNKIIGAKSFAGDGYGPDDKVGHGTHVASIAAGNFVPNASYFRGGQAAGTAAGTSPAAHLAIYRVCRPSPTVCPDYAIVDAFEAAVKDGVDIISVSLGQKTVPPVPDYKDPVTLAAFRAVSRGVLVVAAAGNKGPSPSTFVNDAPWYFTVGAGSVDRRIVADIVLDDGDILEGEALIQGVSSSRYFPLYCPDRRCLGVSTQNASGHIVVCDDLPSGVAKDLYNKGAAHVVSVSDQISGHTLLLEDDGVPTVQVPFTTGQKLREYCKFPDAAAQVSFRGTLVDVAGAPMTAYFSSRGPSSNPSVLKPDILAPGLNILAAGIETERPFVFMSGTSMATPHVSGVAALLKGLHPDWSPAALRSAIVTTASAYDNVGDVILDEQKQRASLFDIGGGHITPQAAADPGLVYEMNATDYGAFLCNVLAGPHDDIQDLIGDQGLNCSTLPAGVQGFQLNYPSIVVPANTTVQRTLTRVGPADGGETYYLFVYMRDPSVKVNVSPRTLEFSNPGDKQIFLVSGEYQGKNKTVEGVLIWNTAHHQINTRMVVHI
ncbi:hypothetical protein CFC21_021886 [Triticum aestivum]|uniref:Subtilisin-like protease n=3 Tax=Triticum TaxID=4564 RepID=A0A3B6C0L4_WHEAT|nr:hypothetical protein CFC21_021886 [Triticum aestivum]